MSMYRKYATRPYFDAGQDRTTSDDGGTVWIVSFGNCVNTYYTEYHAEQFARALTLNGTAYTLEVKRRAA